MARRLPNDAVARLETDQAWKNPSSSPQSWNRPGYNDEPDHSQCRDRSDSHIRDHDASGAGTLGRAVVSAGRRIRQHHSPAVPAPPRPWRSHPRAVRSDCDCSGSDPYGFAAILNRFRAAAGLHPVAYDPDLSSWASQNNAVQCRRGIGHHVNPCGVQNCGWNYADASSVAQGWMHSPGHRQNMLSPSIMRFGIAFGPGPYWTLNARGRPWRSGFTLGLSGHRLRPSPSAGCPSTSEAAAALTITSSPWRPERISTWVPSSRPGGHGLPHGMAVHHGDAVDPGVLADQGGESARSRCLDAPRR